MDCLISHELCLTPPDLQYLLQTRREIADSTLWENGVYKGQLLSNIIKSSTPPLDTEGDDEGKKRGDGRDSEVMQGSGDSTGYLEEYGEKGDGEVMVSDGVTGAGQEHGFVMIYPSPIGHLYDQVSDDDDDDDDDDDNDVD